MLQVSTINGMIQADYIEMPALAFLNQIYTLPSSVAGRLRSFGSLRAPLETDTMKKLTLLNLACDEPSPVRHPFVRGSSTGPLPRFATTSAAISAPSPHALNNEPNCRQFAAEHQQSIQSEGGLVDKTAVNTGHFDVEFCEVEFREASSYIERFGSTLNKHYRTFYDGIHQLILYLRHNLVPGSL